MALSELNRPLLRQAKNWPAGPTDALWDQKRGIWTCHDLIIGHTNAVLLPESSGYLRDINRNLDVPCYNFQINGIGRNRDVYAVYVAGLNKYVIVGHIGNAQQYNIITEAEWDVGLDLGIFNVARQQTFHTESGLNDFDVTLSFDLSVVHWALGSIYTGSFSYTRSYTWVTGVGPDHYDLVSETGQYRHTASTSPPGTGETILALVYFSDSLRFQLTNITNSRDSPSWEGFFYDAPSVTVNDRGPLNSAFGATEATWTAHVQTGIMND